MAEESDQHPEQDAERPVDQEADKPADQEARTPDEPESEADDEQGAESASEEVKEPTDEEAQASGKPESEADDEQGAESASEEVEEPADEAAQASGDEDAEASSEQEAEGSSNPLAQAIAAQKAKLQAELAAKADGDTAESVDSVEPDTDKQLPAEPDPATVTHHAGGTSKKTGLFRRLTTAQLFLIANTLAVVILAASIFRLSFRRVQMSLGYQSDPVKEATESQQETDDLFTVTQGRPEDVKNVSWQKARSAFAKKDYTVALAQYFPLSDLAKKAPGGELMYDFFQLRIGQCFMHLGRASRAEKYLVNASLSESPAVRGAADYRLAALEEQKGRHLQARMKACQAASSFAALLSDCSAAQADCDFLIARVLTRKTLSFYGMDHLIPWSDTQWSDPFAGLDEPDLRKLLGEAVSESDQAMLGPKVQRVSDKSPITRWTASCLQTSIADFLSCFASQVHIDLHWVLVDKPVRNRPVSLHFRRVTSHRLCELAAGSAGLVARFTGKAIIVHNPLACRSMNQQRDLLMSESISVWRRLFLRMPQDKRIAEGYFAVAVLYEHAGNTIDAINEYQLIARRFNEMRIAPPSLLRSANLRMGLRDYTGARANLTSLLDSYPDCKESGDAYAALGEATMKSGLPDKALRIFKKLYFLDLSASSRAFACFGMGKCLYQKGDYKEAVEWINRYIGLSAKAGKKDLPEAYLLLGKSYAAAGAASRAVRAFHLALSARPGSAERMETLIELAHAYRDSGDFTKAIVTLRKIDKDVRGQRQNRRILSLTAQCYRAMGLSEKAASFLRGNITSVRDSRLRAQLGVELAQCYYDAEQFSEAYDTLTDTLEVLPPGASAHKAACRLAEICLKTGKPDQAVTLTRGVLNSSASQQCRKRAQKLLADAYLAKREYENVARTLSKTPTTQPGAKPE